MMAVLTEDSIHWSDGKDMTEKMLSWTLNKPFSGLPQLMIIYRSRSQNLTCNIEFNV